MKYIRTEDGILNKENCINIERYEVEYYSEDGIRFFDDILKQADTIEELCDEFVGVDIETDNGCIWQYDDLGKIKAKMNHYDFKQGKDYEIYGAIWTNKGLIYVAKMNEKGELELV